MPPLVSEILNRFGQPVGGPVDGWTTRAAPPRTVMFGRYCRLEPLLADIHAAPLFEAYGAYSDESNWTYLPYGPFASAEDYAAFVRPMEASFDPVPFAILSREQETPLGVVAYLRVNPEHGSIEVGHVHYAPALKRTVAATEAMYLMMQRAFDELGYRRYEWKCDSRNAASRAAAERLGFRYEGTFRNAMVMKGRNRDTSWFSITAEQWPGVSSALRSWLDPSNFDAGRQNRSLSSFMEAK
jgi:RimJ/RimL family protein N-acetyltransferase